MRKGQELTTLAPSVFGAPSLAHLVAHASAFFDDSTARGTEPLRGDLLALGLSPLPFPLSVTLWAVLLPFPEQRLPGIAPRMPATTQLAQHKSAGVIRGNSVTLVRDNFYLPGNVLCWGRYSFYLR